MAEKEKRALGKGIRALLNNIEKEVEKDPQAVTQQLANLIAMIPIAQIETNPWQPRSEFDEAQLTELSESLKVHGLIQPITVRRLNDRAYQLISGERRLRASKLANLVEIPAYIRIANDQEMLEMALVENIQRAELNPIEVAISYKRLMDECSLTHESLAGRVGKERSTVSNSIRLLKLPPELQLGVKKQLVSMGHARALVGVDDHALQLMLYRETLEQSLSVRKLEELIREYTQPKDKTALVKEVKLLTADQKRVQSNLAHHFGAKVALKQEGNGKGAITINFKDTDDLNRILDTINVVE
jgi:ParB family transcriptional regulator, chromosome partitioning protein